MIVEMVFVADGKQPKTAIRIARLQLNAGMVFVMQGKMRITAGKIVKSLS